DLIEKKSGKMLNLPQNLKVYTFSERLIFTTREINNEQITYRYKIEPEGYTFIDEIKMGVRTSIMDKKDSLNLPTSQFAKVFDYDKIKGDIILRNREAGDKYKPIGLKGTKKVKDILIEKKVLPQDKYKYPVLCDENGIMWLYDYRIDENYKIDENTKKVIRIQFKKDME
ncbi:tRNA lysidine(34) synthetase TilS, partial [Criibacterium bergeronii]